MAHTRPSAFYLQNILSWPSVTISHMSPCYSAPGAIVVLMQQLLMQLCGDFSIRVFDRLLFLEYLNLEYT